MKVQPSTALETQKARELALSGFHYFRRPLSIPPTPNWPKSAPVNGERRLPPSRALHRLSADRGARSHAAQSTRSEGVGSGRVARAKPCWRASLSDRGSGDDSLMIFSLRRAADDAYPGADGATRRRMEKSRRATRWRGAPCAPSRESPARCKEKRPFWALGAVD
jgi:hypothetical protein